MDKRNLIIDRVIHTSYQIERSGESPHKRRSPAAKKPARLTAFPTRNIIQIDLRQSDAGGRNEVGAPAIGTVGWIRRYPLGLVPTPSIESARDRIELIVVGARRLDLRRKWLLTIEKRVKHDGCRNKPNN